MRSLTYCYKKCAVSHQQTAKISLSKHPILPLLQRCAKSHKSYRIDYLRIANNILCFCVFVFRILTAKCDVTKKRTVLGERLKGGSKNSGFMFLPFLAFSVSAAFIFWLPPKVLPLGKSQTSLVFAHLIVPFGVILSSLISHIARYVPSSTYKSTSENRKKINTT